MKEEDPRTLVRYRLERSQSALRDAQNLLEGTGSVEGIINRSYYAMFYAVLALFQQVEKLPRKHSGVISLFDREFYKTGIFPKELSKDLHQAFGLRQKSDYQDLVTISHEVARDLFHQAVGFVDSVSNYLSQAGFKDYDEK